MKARKVLLCLVSLTALLLQIDGSVSAQDVAAAARANRAKKEAATGDASTRNDWYSVTSATLRYRNQDGGMTTLYEFGENQDLKITVEVEENGRRTTGHIMLINGRRQWMLAKDAPLEKGYEIDAMDGPVLDLKLALELLRAAVPGGPSTVKEKATFDLKENRRPITVNTASASGGLEAPWTLHATIEPLAADQWSFELSVLAGGEAVQMSGTWRKENPLVLGDAMPLDGWQIFTVGPTKRMEGNSTIYDYGAEMFKSPAKTLGELRKL